ncbi:hypothetical protein RM545_17335, partial [Zunongwangia sp. F260]
AYKNCAMVSVIFRRKIRRNKYARSFELSQALALFLYFVVRRLFTYPRAKTSKFTEKKAPIAAE